MRVGVLGSGRIGVMHARNLAQTAGVDRVVLMGRDPARLAVSVDQAYAALRPDAPSELAGDLAPRGPVATVTAGAGLTEELPALAGVVVATSTSTPARGRLASGTGGNLTPPRDGLVAIPIAQAAAESIRTGGTVDLDETNQATGRR